MPVNNDTKQQLDVVRKGKSRRFVMLTKGANIVSLIVYKKGAASKFIKQAKDEGTGVPCFGTLIGPGPEIRFQLAVSDGFDKPPVKDPIVRKFLEDEADLKVRPVIEIVATPTLPLDPDDPFTVRFLALQEAVRAAIPMFPEPAERLSAEVDAIGLLLVEEPDSDDAGRRIAAAEARLAEISASAPVETAAPSDADGSDRFKTQLTAALKLAAPLVAVIGEQVKSLAGEARSLYAQGDQEAAKDRLARLLLLVKQTHGRPTPTEMPAPNFEKELLQRFSRLSTDVKTALAGPDAATVQSLVTKVGAALKAKSFEQAEALLDDLTQMLGRRASTAPALSLVKLGRARLEWIDGRKKAIHEIRRLQQALQAEFDGGDQQLELNRAVKRLELLIADLDAKLEDCLDAVLNAAESERSTALAQARVTLQKSQALVDADEIMVELDGNEVLPDMVVAATLRERLQAVAAALA
ncbi:MAG: hypothetical protein J0M17_12860 [Planctomycetes bacterium]|nr:hypothetical protein [Planctomycetota bacterium]